MRRLMMLAALAALTIIPQRAPAEEAARKPSFEAYGFAQLDYIQDFNRVDPAWNAMLRPTRVPTVDGAFGPDGEAIFSVRQTRLGMRASVPAGEYDLKTRIEFDFFGRGTGSPDSAGQNTTRLRQAYASWGGLLGGLTASLANGAVDRAGRLVRLWQEPPPPVEHEHDPPAVLAPAPADDAALPLAPALPTAEPSAPVSSRLPATP